MKHLFTRLVSGVLLLSTLGLYGAGCTKTDAEATARASERVTLTMWGVFDDEASFRSFTQAYRALHPNVSFDYRKLRSEEYDDALINAFARGEGPDIFAVHNTAIGKYQDLIAPLPATITLPYTETTGTIKKETITSLKTNRSLTPANIRNQFVDVVGSDVIRTVRDASTGTTTEAILGLPLSVDTLALFYNKDLLNAAGIANPPAVWDEFLTDVEKLTVYGQSGAILQSGAALGTYRNVDRAFDILSAIMLQNGTQMTSGGAASFANPLSDRTTPGLTAAMFYTDFANPTKTSYTWNETLPNSFEAFVNGRTAFYFGYGYSLPQIRARAPKLNLGIGPLPQIAIGDSAYRPQNYANYWVQTVSRQSTHQDWAWDVVQFMASEAQVGNYLQTAGRPTALRNLIQGQRENEDLAVFAGQLLTAQSWYKGRNPAVTEAAFGSLIDAIRNGVDAEKSIKDAQNKVNQTF